MPKETTRIDTDALLERLVGGGGDRTDDRILGAAGRMLVLGGLGSVEVDAVAAEAGVGRSTVYRRFGDRNGLLAAALAHEARRFFTVLAESVSVRDDVEDQVVTAFCAGLRLARASGLTELLRTDPLLLRLLTVDGGPVLAAARDQLAGLAMARDDRVPAAEATRAAEVLVRLAISFVLTPETALDLDGAGCEDAVRRHIAAVVTPRPR